ncbi:hypothetical protein KL918_005205 [Ogataea parapolymorpha]|uniref:Vacuolar protein sorting-associated protein 27 n=1 Tax=Ogataea parapolymorpha (strain ATCC 26012 / BCRC 20466 / JCM 22074 / NRRL Y-7560 / DL-1) TaxID=871575 RepID=W1QET5_OGAPD|nr:Vacuolar protein sorting-associated protein 27 [Ogataea parapolymorpha DL-1]ESX00087.1 Vacuolar protein sorting-associated protein 27 [Ogataea parapolymorpha DL-1]KAG7864714.1 hypothetical protein KL918_005205 [Ogataea parapolymorpha]KAG7870914.1 hypothetical protein KL916_004465 [Ogataea parapolymorpha]
MAWFGRTNTNVSIEDKISEAASESIPNGEIDLAGALEISDLIRSKQVTSKDAMRALKRRFMSTKNPNLQKSALKLIDFCIKNGGEHFLFDISSKEFIDPIVSTLHDKTLNHTVKEYLLQLIQSWSIMFSTNPKLGYVNQIYNKLQQEGFQFPMITDAIESTLIESKVAPEWEDSDACMLCSTLFTFLNRKHHCRSCGGVFCGTHSSNTCELPELGITIPVRVCDTCYQEHKGKSKLSKKRSKNDTPAGDEDEDLKRAIELSLKESGVPIEASVSSKPAPQAAPTEEDDEEMKAAIAASLADFQKQEAVKSPPVSQLEIAPQPSGLYSNLLPESQSVNSLYTPSYSSAPPASQPPPQTFSPRPAPQIDYNSITGVEDQNIILFAQLVQNLKTAPVEKKLNITNDQALKHLFVSINQIKPKIEFQLKKEVANLEKYQDLYSKTFAVTKIYDEILQLRLAQSQQTYRQYPQQAYYAPPPAPALSQYAALQASDPISQQNSGSYNVQYAPLPHLNSVSQQPVPSSPSQFYPASPAVPDQLSPVASYTEVPKQEPEKPKVQEPVNLIDL